MFNLDSQLDWSHNHLGDSILCVFLERFNRERRPLTLQCMWHHSVGYSPKLNERRKKELNTGISLLPNQIQCNQRSPTQQVEMLSLQHPPHCDGLYPQTEDQDKSLLSYVASVRHSAQAMRRLIPCVTRYIRPQNSQALFSGPMVSMEAGVLFPLAMIQRSSRQRRPEPKFEKLLSLCLGSKWYLLNIPAVSGCLGHDHAEGVEDEARQPQQLHAAADEG